MAADQVTLPPPLSAKHKDSFGFATVSSRLPVILTKVIDSVYRYKNDAVQIYGEEGSVDLKTLVGKLSKLRNELQTDKPVVELDDGYSDKEEWNVYLHRETELNGGQAPSWFRSAWLYVECYMYRRIHSAVIETTHLRELDVFKNQKDEGLAASSDAMHPLLIYLQEVISNCNQGDQSADVHDIFIQLLEVQLWGNKCDLSISAGVENHQKSSPLKQLEQMSYFILADDKECVWRTVREAGEKKAGSVRLDIVLDNAGFELITDLCMADFLLSAGLVQVVHFHGKSVPWFVSDVTRKDFDYTLSFLVESSNETFAKTGKLWQQRVTDGSFVYNDHQFWTLPHDYSEMKATAPDLYRELSHSDLILFKGDLNYRKLVADRQWSPTVAFKAALRGFHPAPLCALRTLKADVVTGLEDEALKKTEADKDWMVSGQWAVVQFCGLREPL